MSKTREISITWNDQDVLAIAEIMGVQLTDEEIGDILDELERGHDAEIGISWLTIQITIENYLDKKKQPV